MVAVGDNVKDLPEYSRPMEANDGTQFALSDFIGVSPLVIFFYPKAATPGCTKEACSFRDEYSNFTNKAKVFGISSDSIDANNSFSLKQRLPFLLLTDRNGRLREALGVKKNLLFLPGRQTFVIGKDGTVLLSFNSFSHADHVPKALEVVNKL